MDALTQLINSRNWSDFDQAWDMFSVMLEDGAVDDFEEDVFEAASRAVDDDLTARYPAETAARNERLRNAAAERFHVARVRTSERHNATPVRLAPSRGPRGYRLMDENFVREHVIG